MHATVKNTANVDAVFGAYSNCSTGSIQNFGVPANGEVNITFFVATSRAFKGMCELTVYDVNSADHKTSAPFWIEFEKYCPITCGGTFVLDNSGDNCQCVCPLKEKEGYTIDTANCAYKPVSNSAMNWSTILNPYLFICGAILLLVVVLFVGILIGRKFIKK
ncbi:MAG: hypothetical protein Sv326_0690 [Candidatus Fermentimicrarchaeum limneticum]|uniref:Uncharacterized protein n=1 Tax=Fermentimicrarchaeum limneticum TaxID=2795018 RepID=A0A7D5XC97_FERL1|nr:MAG: hypothetical protein Sv326_0690 [Candidatus Fermentimicrarchaeum limneticum]